MSKTINLKSLSATQFRTILLIATLALIVSQVGFIIAGQRIILSSSQPVAEAVARSSSSQQTLRNLETVKVTLKRQDATVKKAALVAADTSNTYLYQNNIIDDISAYAAKAGLSPTSYTFSDSASAEGAVTTPPPTATAATDPASTAVTPAASAAPTTVTVAVVFGGDVTYSSLFTFLRLLEGNLLRMEIDGLNLARSSSSPEGASSPDKLDISSLNIKVHTR